MLNAQFGAQLTPIAHQSLNQTFVGPSDRFSQSIFVKVFAPQAQAKWRAETAMTAQLTDWLLDSDESELLLVRQDLPFSPVGAMTTELAFEMGQVLAWFHQRARPFGGIKTPKLPVRKPDFLVAPEIGAWFAARQSELTAQLATIPLVVRHGDVGKRNFATLHGDLTLIDYERAQAGFRQQDWIKLFYQDFHEDTTLIGAFLAGYGEWPAMLKLCWYYCVYTTALGIMAYVNKVPEADFLAVGRRMLQDVNDYIQQSEA